MIFRKLHTLRQFIAKRASMVITDATLDALTDQFCDEFNTIDRNLVGWGTFYKDWIAAPIQNRLLKL